MKISLVATVKDAAEHIGDFLTSLRAQARVPDEVIIVDGGSTDGTAETLRAAANVQLIEAPGANIPRGRNLAIDAATHDTIAVTDADCVLSPGWLAELERTLEGGADVAMGFFRPIATSVFDACAAAVTLPEVWEVKPDRFMPSARSVAFRREAFERAGRYPEWLGIGEDMYLNHRMRDLDLRMDFAPHAVVYWRPRPSVRDTWLQYFRYARGDAIAGMYGRRHALRFGTYGLLSWAALTGRRRLLTALGLAAAAHAGHRLPRAFRLLPNRPADRIKAAGSMPAHIALADAAKMAGYIAGWVERARRGAS